MFWKTLLFQIFPQICFCVQDFIDIVRLLLTAVSIGGLKNYSLTVYLTESFFEVELIV